MFIYTCIKFRMFFSRRLECHNGNCCPGLFDAINRCCLKLMRIDRISIQFLTGWLICQILDHLTELWNVWPNEQFIILDVVVYIIELLIKWLVDLFLDHMTDF